MACGTDDQYAWRHAGSGGAQRGIERKARCQRFRQSIVTCRPDRPGSLGYQFFNDTKGAKAEQKLLLVRLVQSRYDNLFDTSVPPNIGGPDEKE